MEQQNAYFQSLPENKRDNMAQEIEINNRNLFEINQIVNDFNLKNQKITQQPLKNVPPTDTAKP